MALSAATVWEARATGGDDTFGGGYVGGGTGTDYSQQNFAQLSLTDLAAAQNSTTVTSTTGGFTAQMVDNILRVNVAGTNFIVGPYRVMTFVDTHTITVDRAPATAGAGSGASGKIGGALATLNTLAASMVAQNKGWATGAFTTSSTITFSQTTTGAYTCIQGYGSVRGDSGHASLTLQTNSNLIGISGTGQGFKVTQFDIDCGSLTNSTGISVTNNAAVVSFCKVSNFTNSGISSGAAGKVALIENNEVFNGSGSYPAAGIAGGVGTGTIIGNYVHDLTGSTVGILADNGFWVVAFNVVANTLKNGIQGTQNSTIINNTVHGVSGQPGIVIDSGVYSGICKNNIITNCGFGFEILSPGIGAAYEFDGNAYFGNSGGARTNADRVDGIFSVSPYTNVSDVFLTASPYIGPTSGSNADFGLNNTAGAGKACRGANAIRALPGLTSTPSSLLDMGAIQSKGTGKRIEIIR